MRPVPFEHINRVLTPPPGCEDSCDELGVYVNENEVISCWQLDSSELVKLLQNGGHVWLRVVTNTGSQPPVALQVVDPFERQQTPPSST